MKDEILYDLTNVEAALESLSSLINVSIFKLKLLIYKNSDNKEKLYEIIIKKFNIKLQDISIKNLYLKVLHITTSDDECKSIKELGLLNLQEAIREDTTLSRYLKRKEIQIDLEDKVIIYKGVSYRKIKDFDKEINLCFIKIFSDYHYPINAFIYGDNPANYGGNVKDRPEIIGNLADAFDKRIEEEWKTNNTCYMIKFKASIYDFTYDTFELEKDYEEIDEDIELQIKQWLILYSINLIHDLIYTRHSSDKYAYMKKEFKVLPENIIGCIRVK